MTKHQVETGICFVVILWHKYTLAAWRRVYADGTDRRTDRQTDGCQTITLLAYR